MTSPSASPVPCTSCGTLHPDTACPFDDSPLPHANQPGQARLGGKYRLLRCLGAGGLGIVFEAENEDIDRRVAVKVLHKEYAKVAPVVERFRREARAAGGIGHEHIVEVLDLGRTEMGTPFIVMELLQGRDLGSLLAAEKSLAPARVVDVSIQTLLALEAAHARGIVHRDLKPENVFLTTKGERADYVKLVDFGIALVHDPKDFSPRLTKTGAIMGTPYFMSPEQLRGDPDIDHRTDLYSLAVMMYELLSGRNPYSGKSYATLFVEILGEKQASPLDVLRDDLPPGLSEVVMRAMAKDRSQRYANAREMIEGLRAYAPAGVSTMQSRPSSAPLHGPSLTDRPKTPAPIPPTSLGGTGTDVSLPNRKPVFIGAGVLAVVAIGIGAFVATGGASGPQAAPQPQATALAATAAPTPTKVAVRLLVTAPGAVAVVDGREIPGPLVVLEEAAGTAPKIVQIRAPGYATLDLPVTFDASRELPVALTPVAATAAPATAGPTKHPGTARAPRNPYE